MSAALLFAATAAAGFHAVGSPRSHAVTVPQLALAREHARFARCAHPVADFSSTKEAKYKMDAEAGEVAQVPFEVRFSIGNVVAVSGGIFFVVSILSFLINNGETGLLQTLGFVYSIPALVGGLALKYAELPPVPLDTSAKAQAARAAKATTIQEKILSDATRFTYGDAHMEDPLKALKLAPRGMGPPKLVRLSESATEQGEYRLAMQFFAPNTPYRVWQDRAPRYARFFGPTVRATIRKVDSDKRLVELALITTAAGEDDTPLEVLEDGTTGPIVSAAEAREAEDAAAAAAAPPRGVI